ncbi:hypothetical protein ACFP2T_22000 [Plantactinospora solaniradicis]|uniref:Uncharacterized protein n=1 Tax=Plantactinospora solaniradicis TaxID=1723736 RepID=A0ABW1KCV8_9ACTN
MDIKRQAVERMLAAMWTANSRRYGNHLLQPFRLNGDRLTRFGHENRAAPGQRFRCWGRL